MILTCLGLSTTKLLQGEWIISTGNWDFKKVDKIIDSHKIEIDISSDKGNNFEMTILQLKDENNQLSKDGICAKEYIKELQNNIKILQEQHSTLQQKNHRLTEDANKDQRDLKQQLQEEKLYFTKWKSIKENETLQFQKDNEELIQRIQSLESNHMNLVQQLLFQENKIKLLKNKAANPSHPTNVSHLSYHDNDNNDREFDQEIQTSIQSPKTINDRSQKISKSSTFVSHPVAPSNPRPLKALSRPTSRSDMIEDETCNIQDSSIYEKKILVGNQVNSTMDSSLPTLVSKENKSNAQLYSTQKTNIHKSISSFASLSLPDIQQPSDYPQTNQKTKIKEIYSMSLLDSENESHDLNTIEQEYFTQDNSLSSNVYTSKSKLPRMVRTLKPRV